MNTTFVFLVLLCIFLIVGLGINYGNIFSQTITNMNSYKPSTISSTKYNSPDDYFFDANASQGVFSNMVDFNSPILEGLTTQNTPIIPQPSTGGSPQGSVVTGGSLVDEKTAIAAAKATEDAAKIAVAKKNEIEQIVKKATTPEQVTEKMVSEVSPLVLQAKNAETIAKTKESEAKSAAAKSSAPAAKSAASQADNSMKKAVEASITCAIILAELQKVLAKNKSGATTAYCLNTKYGCCKDGKTVRNEKGNNCVPDESGGTSREEYYCPDGITVKKNNGQNCPTYVGTCGNGFIQSPDGSCQPNIVNSTLNTTTSSNSWQYTNESNLNNYQPVYCPDGKTIKNSDGSNCTLNAWKFSGPNVTAYAGVGPNNTRYMIEGPNGNIIYGSTANCASTPYGCCQDGTTIRNADGINCTSQLAQNNVELPTPIGGCAGTQYGCCPDNVTARNVNGSNCPIYPVSPTTNTVFIPPPTNPYYKPPYDHPHSDHHSGDTNTNSNNTNTNTNSNSNTNTNTNSNTNTNTNSNTNTNTNYKPLNTDYTLNSSTTSNLLNTPVQPTAQTNPAASYFSSLLGSASPATEQGKPAICPAPRPCPPCGRCPEPSFECKKVPNYASTNSEFLPVPVLGDFSQFGM